MPWRRSLPKTMCWHWLVLHVILLLVTTCADLSDCLVLPPIHWNVSNAMFKTSNNDHVIEVNLLDEVDFVCPHFGRGRDTKGYEYYIIYQVTKREYDDCNLYSDSRAVMIVNCSSPSHRKRFTILFDDFIAIPNAPEFTPGGTYYYITTSTGSQMGLTNPHQGACLYNNMKLTIKVCCETTTSLPKNITLPAKPTPTTATASSSSSSPSSSVTHSPPRPRHTTGSRHGGGASTPKASTTTVPSTTKRTTTTLRPQHSTTNTRWRSKTTSAENKLNTDSSKDKGGKGKQEEENSINKPKHENLVNGSPRTWHVSWTVVFVNSLLTLRTLRR